MNILKKTCKLFIPPKQDIFQQIKISQAEKIKP